MLNQFMHLNRFDLKTKGLALYIDVHMDLNDPEKKEHGVKIHIDEHFHVRSNDVLHFKERVLPKVGNKPIPGVPMPSLKVSESIFNLETISWNYIKMDSQSHNISIRLINTVKESTKEEEIIIYSPLGSIEIRMRYNMELLSKEYLAISKKWLHLVIKWVELSADVDIDVITPLLRYIDKQHALEPGIQDELSISIMVDCAAMIRLNSEFVNMNKIFKSSSNDSDGLYPMLGLNGQALKYIAIVLNSHKFISIKAFVHNLFKAGGDNSEEFVDTFIQIFFDLMAKDAFEYRVSYFT